MVRYLGVFLDLKFRYNGWYNLGIMGIMVDLWGISILYNIVNNVKFILIRDLLFCIVW